MFLLPVRSLPKYGGPDIRYRRKPSWHCRKPHGLLVAHGIFLRVICDKQFNLELLAHTVDGVSIFLRTINLGFGCFLQKHHFFSHITLYTRFQFRTCFGTGFDCIVVDGF